MNWLFDLKLRRLQKKRHRIAARYSKLYRMAKKKNKGHDECEQISGEASMDDQIAEYEIESLVTWELVRRAELLFIPVPASTDNEYWKDAYAPNQRHLTALGVSKVRDAIREEERKRREARLSFLDIAAKLVVMLTGLVGATIGLVSILKK